MSKQIVMPILENNGSLAQKILKLKEEQIELTIACLNYGLWDGRDSKKNLAEEAFDCLQVSLGIVLELEKSMHIDLERANDAHIAKLANRQIWTMQDEMVRIKIPG